MKYIEEVPYWRECYTGIGESVIGREMYVNVAIGKRLKRTIWEKTSWFKAHVETRNRKRKRRAESECCAGIGESVIGREMYVHVATDA